MPLSQADRLIRIATPLEDDDFVVLSFTGTDTNGDGNMSCWIRVSQNWAGGRWGGMHIPRVGQEVIVNFLESDPDRPVVTGRLYTTNEEGIGAIRNLVPGSFKFMCRTSERVHKHYKADY